MPRFCFVYKFQVFDLDLHISQPTKMNQKNNKLIPITIRQIEVLDGSGVLELKMPPIINKINPETKKSTLNNRERKALENHPLGRGIFLSG